ncbi:MAG: hypothetical protein HPY74_00140 [Firmicutes bacterium]|nr:hypothetical protein [Bacillota bacterium]
MIKAFKGLRALKITKYNNANIIGDYTRFKVPEFDRMKLKMLVDKYSLDRVIESGRTDWDKLNLLRQWVKSRWVHGWSPVPKGGHALDILEAAEKGATFACGVYSSVYQQCCAALGFPARLVSILRDGSDIPDPIDAINTGHCINEVWTNEYKKWAVIDTDMDCYYEKDGIPLNAYEIRKAWLNGEASKVLQVPERTVTDVLPEDLEGYLKRHYKAAEDLMGKDYADRYISKTSDVYTVWSRFTENKNMHFYTYVIIGAGEKNYMFADEKEGPLLLVNEYPIQRAWPNITWTSNSDDVYFTLNQTFIEIRVVDGQEKPFQLEVKMKNTDPDFSYYQVCIDTGEWKESEPEFIWTIREGDNQIRARTVNKKGRYGIESSITVNLSFEV